MTSLQVAQKCIPGLAGTWTVQMDARIGMAAAIMSVF